MFYQNKLLFSPPVDAGSYTKAKINPKRMHRAIKKQLTAQGIGTKSQQALRLQQQEGKTVRKKTSREQKK